MNIFPIKIYEPKLVTLQVAAGLRELITCGHLKPGEKLKEIEIAESLGVSRSPIREALRILYHEGLVDIISRRGAYVHKITLEDVKNIYQTKEMIEGFAAPLAVENMTDQDISEVEELWEKMKFLSRDKELEKYLEASSDFHNKIIECARNKKIEKIYQGIRTSITFLRSVVLNSDKRMESSLLEHQLIVDALKARDKDMAMKRSCEHVRKGMNHLMEMIRKQNNIL